MPGHLNTAPFPPTPQRPLQGLTILLVEDSRYACDTVRMMALRSGAKLRRADCLRSAHRHLQVYRPGAIIIDIGLPDGNGLTLVQELHRARPRIQTIVGLSGDDTHRAEALECGADAFLDKPITSLAMFQKTLLTAMPEDMRPKGPRNIETVHLPDAAQSFADDIDHAIGLLRDEPANLPYILQFLESVAMSSDNRPLKDILQPLSSQPVPASDHERVATALKRSLAGMMLTELA